MISVADFWRQHLKKIRPGQNARGVGRLECRFMSHEEITRIAAALRTAIRLSGISHRQVERELKLSTGYLTRILAGQVELRVRHVLDVCRVIGIAPDRFFGALFPLPGGAESMTRLERGLAQLHPPPPGLAAARSTAADAAASEGRSKSVSELMLRVRQAVDELEAVAPAERLDRVLDRFRGLSDLAAVDRRHFSRFFRLYKHHMMSSRQYRPQPFDGALTLFRAAEPSHDVLEDRALRAEPSLGWDTLSHLPVAVIDVPGDHSTMLAQPQVAHLAAQLRRSLEAPGAGRSAAAALPEREPHDLRA